MPKVAGPGSSSESSDIAFPPEPHPLLLVRAPHVLNDTRWHSATSSQKSISASTQATFAILRSAPRVLRSLFARPPSLFPRPPLAPPRAPSPPPRPRPPREPWPCCRGPCCASRAPSPSSPLAGLLPANSCRARILSFFGCGYQRQESRSNTERSEEALHSARASRASPRAARRRARSARGGRRAPWSA